MICMSIRAMERMTTRPNALAHVQSFDHLITRAILLHYLTTLLLYNSRIKTQDLLIAEWSLWIVQISYKDFFIWGYLGNSLRSKLKLFGRKKYLVASLVCQLIMGLKVFMYVLGSVNVTWEKRKLKIAVCSSLKKSLFVTTVNTFYCQRTASNICI